MDNGFCRFLVLGRVFYETKEKKNQNKMEYKGIRYLCSDFIFHYFWGQDGGC